MQDLRLAWRALRATPIVSLIAVLSLALGIGANTAIFSLVNTVLLRSLPVADPQRLVLLGTTDRQRWRNDWTFDTWDALRTRTDAFDGAFATGDGFGSARISIASGDTQSGNLLFGSGEIFSTLGLRPVLGRFFTSDDDVRGGGPHGPVAVISYGFWQRQFGGAASAIGTPVRVDDGAFTIIGVTPESFLGLEVGRGFDVLVPLNTEPLVHASSSMISDPTIPMWLRVMLRLKPDQSIESATATLRALQPVIREQGMPPALDRLPQSKREFLKTPFELRPAATGTSFLREEYTRPLLALFVIVALVLLIACANIANLQLARATVRRHEMSVRRALGASRWRLARQLLIESVLLAAIGAALGLLIAIWSSRALVSQLTSVIDTIVLDLSLDWRVLGFTAVAATLTAVLFGTAPAWRSARVEPIEALKEQGRQPAGASRSRLASGIVIAQVALSLVLLVAAGLFVRTFERLAHVSTGFDVDRLLMVNVDASHTAIAPEQRGAFYQRLVDAVSTVPGIAHASGSVMAPFGMSIGLDIYRPGEQPPTAAAPRGKRATMFQTMPGWIDTYGLTLKAGRDLNARDAAHAPPVMLVNEAFVRAHLGGGTAVDERIGLAVVGRALTTRQIVGVVSDSISGSLREPPAPTIYLPLAQWDLPVPVMPRMYVTVRAPGEIAPAALAQSVTAALLAVDHSLRVTAQPLQQQVRRASGQERLLALLSGCFGALALLLAAIGLYGVTAYAVSRRRVEIGIRLALGAAPPTVVQLILQRVAWHVATGIALGAAASAWLGQFAASLLFGITARDPMTLSFAALTLCAIAAIAGGLPATRASRIDPARVLRDQ